MDDYHKAGIIAAQALQYGKGLIIKGSSLLEVTEKVEHHILKAGGKLAFPVQISLNEVAAHYCAQEEEKTAFDNQLAKLDIGVHINGKIADTAATVDLSGEHAELVEASSKALEAAIAAVRPGVKVSEIGKAINAAMQELGFNPIHNLTGHGLTDYNVHALPTIPNFDTGDPTRLEEGQVIAIEPFATKAAGFVHEVGTAEVFQLIVAKPVRSPISREILAEISTYHGLPFARRWLARKFSQQKVNIAFNDLLRSNILREYRPLAERTNALVSQAEHTIIVKEKPEIITLLQ